MHSHMEEQRQNMVRAQLIQRGIRNTDVLNAMASVPRHAFVPEHLQERAYEDNALLLDDGQVISQPYIVALMAEALALQGHERVLEVGTGSGYAAAILGQLAGEVITLERSPELAEAAQARFAQLGYSNISVHVADGTMGWSRSAPYDAISIPAAAPWVPRPLRGQVADGGRLIIPLGSRQTQVLVRLQRRGDEMISDRLSGVRFSPLIGQHSWNTSQVTDKPGAN
jgi:protein-L-isoaspartate(D-aspartate) O-methyltransferase